MSVQVDEPDLPPIICIERIEQLGICDQKCLWQRSCNKLHICAQFVYSGKCSYEKDEHCRFGHDLKSPHNSWVLQQNGLEELTIEILRRTHLQNRKNIKSVPICPNYNSEEQHHDEDKCTALHICYKHRYEGCIRESCSLSHELTDERSKRILKHYGIHDAETLPQIFRMMQEGPNIEMPRFLEYFVAIEKIGSGGFSTVYRAKHILDQQTYAVKRIPIRPDKVEEAKKEVEILSNLEHRNIIRYFYSWIDSSNRNLNEQWICLYIQMEYCDEKTLENIVYKDDKFKLPLQKMFCQIVDAVEYIHSKNIVHGDLKPQNIFIERGSSNIKIGDFGIALDFSDGDRLPKEYACATSSGKKDAEKLKKSDDINSLVLIALKMFCQMKNEEEFKKLERESKKSVPKQQAPNINPKMYQLIHRMLNADNTGEEITAKELQKELQTYQDRHSEIDILELSAELDRIIPDQGHIEEHLPLDR